MTAPSSALRDLLAQLPPESVLTDDESRFRASFDNLRLSVLPEAVVRPRDESEIEAVLALANRDGIAVTPRGAGSATTGAATPVRGGWVLDLSHWRNLHIDTRQGYAYAQPGVTVAELQDSAAKQGWFYPPDPGSRAYATLGGTIATNAGGMRGAKYGVTRDYVLALEGFMPTGEWVRWGADLRKFASGYNVRDLWIGSEGALGIITGAVLRLVPKPKARATMLAGYPDEKTALRAVRRIVRSRLNPSILEFLDRQTVACALRHLEHNPSIPRPPRSFPRRTMALLLVECDGDPSVVAATHERLQRLLEPGSISQASARTPRTAERLWAIRRNCSHAMFQMGDSKINEDIVVPLDSQPELIQLTLELNQRTGLATPTFGHAADGNFHVHVMFNRADTDQRARADEAIDTIMAHVVGTGGAITGEHGVGLAKSPFLSLQHSDAEIRAMRAIKDALDPRGILNPGKVFEPFRVGEHPRVDARMPWD